MLGVYAGGPSHCQEFAAWLGSPVPIGPSTGLGDHHICTTAVNATPTPFPNAAARYRQLFGVST